MGPIRLILYAIVALVAYLSPKLDHQTVPTIWAWIVAGIAAEVFFSGDLPSLTSRGGGQDEDRFRPKLRSANIYLFLLAAVIAVITRTVDLSRASFLTWLVVGWAGAIFFSYVTDLVTKAGIRLAVASVTPSGPVGAGPSSNITGVYAGLLTFVLCALVEVFSGPRLTDWEIHEEQLHGKYSGATVLPLVLILFVWFVVPVFGGIAAASTFQRARRIIDQRVSSRPIYAVIGVAIFIVVTLVLYVRIYGSFNDELSRLHNAGARCTPTC